MSILRGRGELMQVLAVEDAIKTPAPVYSVAVAPAADSEDMLLAAGAGGACIIWRLPATHNARFQRIPEYGRWVLDEIVQTRAERITTLGLATTSLPSAASRASSCTKRAHRVKAWPHGPRLSLIRI